MYSHFNCLEVTFKINNLMYWIIKLVWNNLWLTLVGNVWPAKHSPTVSRKLLKGIKGKKHIISKLVHVNVLICFQHLLNVFITSENTLGVTSSRKMVTTWQTHGKENSQFMTRERMGMLVQVLSQHSHQITMAYITFWGMCGSGLKIGGPYDTLLTSRKIQ